MLLFHSQEIAVADDLASLDPFIDPDNLLRAGHHLAAPAAVGEHFEDGLVFPPQRHHLRFFFLESIRDLAGLIDGLLVYAELAELIREFVVVVGVR